MKKIKKNILIVDDSSNLRIVTKRYLSAGTYDDFELFYFDAGNGEEAEEILQNQNISDDPIDIVILDWMMPKMTGLEFLTKIRSVPIFQERPEVIMLTAETNHAQMEACLKYNIKKYILKPFTQEMLTRVLHEVLTHTNTGEIRHGV
jgi:CheY-like chemotaxis protein